MRVLCFLILIALLAAIGVFAYQNQEPVTVHYLRNQLTTTMALLMAGVYVAGMLTGWSVVGMFKRTIQRVSERPVQ